MPENHTKKNLRQNNNTWKAALNEARERWKEKESVLFEEKEGLGYGKLSVEDFLLEFPAVDKPAGEVSQIIRLQSDFKTLEEERQILWCEEIIVQNLNKKHAVVHQDQFYILTEKRNPIFGGLDFGLESKQSFRSTYENKQIQCYDGKYRSKADIWLKSPERREYTGIVFDTRGCIDDYYNIWKGFAIQPQQGDCSLYWGHLRDNICAGNSECFNYIRKWLAYVFQHPNILHTAIVLTGSQGTGKNSFVEPLGRLLGPHYVPLSNISELLSNFNSHLKNALIVHANEALWGGDRRDIGTLKAMITEEHCLIESKGKDRIKVKNHKHLIMSSNEDWPVHLDADDRRFFVVRLSDRHKEDGAYFESLAKQLSLGGYAALLYDLMHENVNGFKPTSMPQSEIAFDIKFRSADSVHKYIYEALLNGCFSIGGTEPGGVWQNLSTHAVYDDYVNWTQINGEKKVANTIFGKRLMSLIRSIRKTRPIIVGIRTWMYEFPTLYQARHEFCTAYKSNNSIWLEGVNPEDDESKNGPNTVQT